MNLHNCRATNALSFRKKKVEKSFPFVD